MEDTKTVLGIDPGLATIGFAIVSGTIAESRLIDFGVITTQAGVEFSERLKIIGEDISELLRQFTPDLVCVEELYFSVNTKTALSVAHARGVILAQIAQFGLVPVPIPPNHVKLTVTGDGGADKRQVQDMVCLHFGLDEVPQPDDAADAIALAYCGLTRRLDL